MNQSARIGRKIGAAFGVVVFLVFGLVPGFYFGSYGSLVVLNHLMGGPVEANILVRMVVVMGTVLGLFCTASVSIVLGAVAGTLLGYATEALTAKKAVEQEAESR
ncbi:MAG: hypothetical protein M0Z59_09760 [Nitrospiraceae bacterium]|nr:hypothetical protein [Nitrospiraceae bacterium]